jgi:hypothetical protein
MAFLGGLLSSALPFLGNALKGAIGGVAQAVQRGGGIGDVLKGAGVGALSGLVGQGDQQERIEPQPVRDAPEFKPKPPKPISRPRIKVPQMIYRKKKKAKARR